MSTQQLSSSPPMVRLANGQLVMASRSNKPTMPRKLLIVVQFWNGDKDAAEDLCGLIADLERVKNREADILLFGRSDATAPSRDIISKLEAKFDKVMFERCRRAAPNTGNSHPFAPNQMFYDMVALFSQVPPWAQNYYAFVNLETDCVPTRPGWIGELTKAFKHADSEGHGCVGFVHDDVKRHMNGVGVYAIDFWSRVGSNKLGGGSPQIAYDIRHAETILQFASDSPLFYFEFRRPTISPEELFAERRQGIAPAIWHGVKDNTAREAVRARHITFTELKQLSRQTVLTFYQPSDYTSQSESAALLELWREGWRSRGWNPVILSMRDASKHSRFKEITDRVKLLPRIGSESAAMNRFMRWVALARVGGGLMVDYDLIPASFTPNDIQDDNFAVFDQETGELCGLRLDREASIRWLDAIYFYDALPDDFVNEKPCVTDATVLKASLEQVGITKENVVNASQFGLGEWKNADVIHFSQSALNKQKAGQRKSVAVDAYLRAK